MWRSMKRYVPASFERPPETLNLPPSGGDTCAPFRLLPRMSRRTGLIVWPAHHEGGSTFCTDTGASCARARPATSTTSAHAAKPFAKGIADRITVILRPSASAPPRRLTPERAHVGDDGGELLPRELLLEGWHLAAAVGDRGDHARVAALALPRRVGQVGRLDYLGHARAAGPVRAVAARAPRLVDGAAALRLRPAPSALRPGRLRDAGDRRRGREQAGGRQRQKEF